VVLASGVDVEKARTALLAEFDRISREAISDGELKRAKNQLLAQKLHGRETAAEKRKRLRKPLCSSGTRTR
jgi:hypothetical protein